MWDEGTSDDDPEDGGVGYEGCMQGGGTWMDVVNVTVDGSTGQTTISQSGVDTGVDRWNGDPLQGFWQNYYDKINAGKAALNAKPTPEQYIQAIADAAPTVCGGGFFAFGGPRAKRRTANWQALRALPVVL